MRTLTNRSFYETNRDEMVNELQALGFSRPLLVKAGENDLHFLYSTMVKGIGISKEKRDEQLLELHAYRTGCNSVKQYISG